MTGRLTRIVQLPRIPVPAIGVPLPERTITIEGPMQTEAFQVAQIMFDKVRGANESYGCGGGADGRDTIGDQVFDTFVRSQPTDTNWQMWEQGLGAQQVKVSDAMESPFRARREWNAARVERSSSLGDIESRVKHEATITLTHTPG
jgi:hypothetical protein